VAGAVLRGDDQIAKSLAKSFLRLPTEDVGGVAVPPCNEALNIHHDYRIECGV
jgi:hypothetical protein